MLIFTDDCVFLIFLKKLFKLRIFFWKKQQMGKRGEWGKSELIILEVFIF